MAIPLVTFLVVANLNISCGIYSGSIITSGSTFTSISIPQVTIVVVANISALAVAFIME